ncbi:MAG TPA: hypothetical protein VG106_14230 [Vicinamibacterales bacterium]|nr:hypothetical protein [Vicinamibacterales bacterium]
MPQTFRSRSAVFCCACALAAALPAAAQDSKSSPAAKALVAAMDSAKLDSVAAADPAEPGTFAAALYIPGTQLLVVAARYSAPQLLMDKLARKEYRDVYIDLNSASIPDTKIFVMDQGVDGLIARPDGDDPADTWEAGKTQLVFDGKWRNAKMSEEEYMKAFTEADDRYTRILTLLTAQAKGKTGS